MMRLSRLLFCGIAAVCLVAIGAESAQESLGDKIKKLIAPTPTPTPPKRHKSSTAKKKSPTPTPTPRPKARSSQKKTEEESEADDPSPSASPKRHKKSSPKPEGSPTAAEKKRRQASPSPSAKERPEPTSEESSAPKKKKHHKTSTSPEETPSPSPTVTPAAEETETPEPTATPNKKGAPVSISTDQIVGYADYSPEVQKVISLALDLASRGLYYKYGSADPESGGMDCSGFVHYVLSNNGVRDVPRDSGEQYNWLRRAGKFEPVISRKEDSYELDHLKPGDLLFWTGTYQIERDPPITHAMIYLGREKGTKQRIMVGASDGRTYHGESRYGVSVFDFKIPSTSRANEGRLSPNFVGYGHVPLPQ